MIAPDPGEAESAVAPPREPEPRDAACLERLTALGVVFTEQAPIDPDGACHVDHPLAVTALGAGVSIEPEAVMNCRTAEALALWMAHVVAPAAKEHLDATPQTVVHDSTYVCRTRNNAPGGKLSEHAHANAVDVAAIAFAGREPLKIGPHDGGGAEAGFQAAIRAGACGYFTTVLGPGSDAAHAEHFHFDLAARRGGYRLCDLGAAHTARAP
jgi:hypothetical protein